MFAAEKVALRPVGSTEPHASMCPARRPATHNEITLTDDQVDGDLEIGEGGAKVVGDLLLSRRTGPCLCRPKIMAHVVVGEHLIGEIRIAVVPYLVVEAAHELLVLLDRHRGPTRSATATIASTITGTLYGDGPCPGAERACRPGSPHSSTIRSLKPLITAAFSLKPGAAWT